MVQYRSRITGSAFTAKVEFYRVSFLLDGRKKSVPASVIDTVTIQPNGYTKLTLRFRRDLLVPSSHGEALELVKALNGLIAERRAVEHRRQTSRISKPTIGIH